jgi:DNA-binding Lrp family transcriptional regulator
VKAYIMIAADPGQTTKVLAALKEIDAIAEVHEVMGPYDIVAKLDVFGLSEVPFILSTRIRAIPGVQNTTTLVAFPGG